MKTNSFISVIIVLILIGMSSCDEDGELPDYCLNFNAVECAQSCVIDPYQCQEASFDIYPELKKNMDSIRAVSKLPVRE